MSGYISEMLQRYDCVIIPSFGGFVANYQGAKIHPTQHIFQPPCKNIAFNKNLVSNDGLLANELVVAMDVTYHEALQIIDRFVFDLNNRLSDGHKVDIPQVGSLKLDVEKNIQFVPSGTVNYLHESYGLFNFQSSAIQRSGYNVPFEIKFKDRPSVKPKKRSAKIKYLVPAAILPLAAAVLLLLPVGQHFKNNIATQVSGYFSGKPLAVSVYKNNSHNFDLHSSIASEIIMPDVVPAPSNAVAETASVAVNEVKITNDKVADYAIITGCFALRENAEKQVQQLAEKNISASIIGQSKTGLYRVSAGNFNDANEANNALQQVKNTQPEAWLLKN